MSNKKIEFEAFKKYPGGELVLTYDVYSYISLCNVKRREVLTAVYKSDKRWFIPGINKTFRSLEKAINYGKEHFSEKLSSPECNSVQGNFFKVKPKFKKL